MADVADKERVPRWLGERRHFSRTHSPTHSKHCFESTRCGVLFALTFLERSYSLDNKWVSYGCQLAFMFVRLF